MGKEVENKQIAGGRIKNVAVIGSGLMGHGIAQVFAQGGCSVTINDLNEGILQKAKERIASNLGTFIEMGLGEEKAIDSIMSRIKPTTDLQEAVAEADFVTEAVPEDLDLKKEVFKEIDTATGKDTIIASNTSMLSITEIGKWVNNKDRLIITHWFNPPYLIPVVEVVRGELTSPEVLREVPGFLVNRIQTAMFREVLSLLEGGVAQAEEIDTAVKGSFGLRLATIGPLEAADLGGLDLWYKGIRHLYKFLDNSLGPQKILKEKVERGHLGQKTGRGFFEYQDDSLKGIKEKERDRKLIQLLKVLYKEKK
jgi:3-hydroxybutyryl-CoA dehydrogenase